MVTATEEVFTVASVTGIGLVGGVGLVAVFWLQPANHNVNSEKSEIMNTFFDLVILNEIIK